MRTLKKSLCLVLALVFVLGLCTIGSNAAFAQYTDLDKVTYDEAVEVLSGLGVIEGYPDGTFNPTANVTRAEAAAMIARMMLGREDADKLPVGDVKFSDVPETNWAAKYIAFCANRGIIVGMGDGTFHPAENVTGTQMATMLLRALGYGVMGEYEGKGWDINAVADALYYGVFKDSKVVDFSNAATREETALYVWNTMWIQLVGYDVDLNYYNGREYRENGDYYPLTFAKDAFNLVKWDYAQILANQATGEEYTYVRLLTGYEYAKDADGKEIKDKKYPVYQYIYLNTETGLDLIGHEVTIYFKDEIKEDKVNKLDYYDIFYIKDESTVVSAGRDFLTYDDLYRVLKTANKNNVDTWFAYIDKWVNYDYRTGLTAGPATDLDSFGKYYKVSDLKGQKSTNDSLAWILVSSTWILNHNGEILLVLGSSYKLGKVKVIDETNDEVEVKVWTNDSYYVDDAATYGDLYYLNSRDVFVKADIAKIYIEKYDWWYRAYDANGNALCYLTEDGDYYYLTFESVPKSAKEVDNSGYDDEIFELKFHDTSLVYDGIAKGDYVVVQPQGELTFIKETFTVEEEVSERAQSMGSWKFNAYSKDSNYGIPVDEQEDDLDGIGVGDLCKFYIVKGAFSDTYFAVEVLERADTAGYVYLNYATVVSEHTDWDLDRVIKVQLINEEGEELIYKMTVDKYLAIGGTVTYTTDEDGNKIPDLESIKKDEVPVGLYTAKVRRGYVTLTEDTENQTEFTKKDGRNSFLKANGVIYYVTEDTKVIYFTGYAENLVITVTSKLADLANDKDYQVYAVSKRTGGSYKLSTVWANQEAPAVYGDEIMFLNYSKYSYYNDVVGYNKAGSTNDVPYYSAYIDGVAKEKLHLIADETVYANDDLSFNEGFYEFIYDEETGYYTISPITKRAYTGYSVKLTEENVVYDAKKDAYLLYTDGSDGVELVCEIKDVSGGTTAKTKTDSAINSFERLYEMLQAGYKVYVNYMYTVVDDTEVPTGVMYVVYVDNSNPKD